MDTIPSSELIKRLAERDDAEAWASLVVRHAPDMRRISAAILGHDGADDAVQEACLHLRRGAARFRPLGDDAEADARRWLARIAANCALSLRQAERRRRTREQTWAREAAAGDVATDAPEPAASAPLMDALAELSETQRRPVVLRYFVGVDGEELARELGCSAGAARVRLHRALARLRRRLERVGAMPALALLDRIGAGGTPSAPEPELLACWLSRTARPRLPVAAVFGAASAMRRALIAAGVAVVVSLSVLAAHGGASEPTPPPQEAPVALDDATKEAARRAAHAGNVFACALYRQLAGARGNVVFSPYSLATVLAMTAGGARGATRDELAGALGMPAGDAAHADRAALAASLAASAKEAGWRFDQATSLWGARGARWRPEFLALCRDRYRAALDDLDFSDAAAAAARINRWASDATGGRIPELIGAGMIDATTRLVLADAVRVHAAWSHPFAKEDTREDDFAAESGAVRVPMMHRRSDFLLAHRDGVRVLGVGTGLGSLDLFLVLPDDPAPAALAALEAKLDAEQLRAWVRASEYALVDLALPRFAISQTLDATPRLQGLGIRTAFTPAADLSGIAEQPLRISAVAHRALLSVDELGVDAAAATAEIVALALDTREPQAFRCDRPFLVMLRDAESGAILFLGRVADPTQR